MKPPLVFLLSILTNEVLTVMKRDGTLQEPLQSIVKPTFNVSWENNSQYQITFTAVYDGSVAYALLTAENIVTWQGQQFVIKSNVPNYSGGYATVAITATHIYMDCKKIFQHSKKDSTLTYSVSDVLSFYFANNQFGYSYEVKGTFAKQQISDLGGGNAFDGLSQIVSTWPDAFIFPDNKKIIVYDKATFAKNLGNRLGYGHNSDNMALTYDSTNLVNQLTVISAQKDDGSSYWQPHVVKDDTSISEYGVWDGGDFSDDRFTDVNAADKAAKAQLVTEPSISITLDCLDSDVPIAGEVRRLEILDTGFITDVMVLAYSYYPLDKSQKPTVTLNSNAKTILDYQKSNKRQLNNAKQNSAALANAIKNANNKIIEVGNDVEEIKNSQPKSWVVGFVEEVDDGE
ncbi:prophage endopeptidase tail family protein [Weissella paramesenteroides]|uniref:prophage endopeptidase tail family protein n=1 Tax=Weissella paramesenteroides TaxID=1249 RepID=UPI00140B9EBC|nr:prophage endopeptidase tail family protein [Weissella paramesenteroides]